MNIVDYTVTFIDYPNNTDWAVIFYCSGCCHKCVDCHNSQLQDSSKGIKYNTTELYNLIKKETRKNKTNKIVFSGGDPLYPTNIDTLKDFLNLYGNEFEITIYTGYNIEYVKSHEIKNFNFIKCGIFDKNQKQISGNFESYFQLASKNQNFYNDKYEQLSTNGRLFYENSTEN